MFCPKCSQQQVSEDIRFCSRCGFQLNVVKALLVNDSLPSQPEPQKSSRSFSKRDMSLGAALMFIFAFAMAAITVDLPPSHSARILLLVIAWLVLTLLLNIKPMLQYFLKGDTPSRTSEISDADGILGFAAKVKHTALPSARSIPADAYMAPAATTAEMAPPPSVTDETTNLFNKGNQ